jgi:hypothetical protein
MMIRASSFDSSVARSRQKVSAIGVQKEGQMRARKGPESWTSSQVPRQERKSLAASWFGHGQEVKWEEDFAFCEMRQDNKREILLKYNIPSWGAHTRRSARCGWKSYRVDEMLQLFCSVKGLTCGIMVF